MAKDKPQSGRITIIALASSEDDDSNKRYYNVTHQAFKTTEDAKRYLKKQGTAGVEYTIVQVKTTVKLEQQTINKLIAIPPSVE